MIFNSVYDKMMISQKDSHSIPQYRLHVFLVATFSPFLNSQELLFVQQQCCHSRTVLYNLQWTGLVLLSCLLFVITSQLWVCSYRGNGK